MKSASYIRNKFGLRCEPDEIRDLRVLLFDDVVTSGSTLKECAKVLLENGAMAVSGLTIGCAETSEESWGNSAAG